MNYLISAYSVNPYKGSEDSIGWNWVLQHEKHYKTGDRIVLLTKRYNEEDTRRGIEEFGIKHIELAICEVPGFLNWFREKYSFFHHMYYILWQHWAYKWVKKSGIKFDVIHHVTMNDYRIPGEMYKIKDAYTILGPIGGAQVTPKSLKCYEKNKLAAWFRELVNRSCSYNPFYKKAIKSFSKIYCINEETKKQLEGILEREIELLPELAIRENYRNLNVIHKNNETCRLIYVGRIIGKKGLDLMLDAIERVSLDKKWSLSIYGGGEDEARIKARIKTLKCTDRIQMNGNCSLEQVKEAYKNGDIFILPSLRETSGNVLLEAMAYAIPVIALDNSFSASLKKNDCGIFVDTKNDRETIVSNFSKAIEKLIIESDYRRKLGKNGYKYANKITWDSKYEMIYDFKSNGF